MANPLTKIDLRHLHYFVVVFDCGGFRKAAEELGISESTISRRIRDLEDCLGASLFQRHQGGISLTYAGHSFLQRARNILINISDGAMDINAIGRAENGFVRIGISTSIASGFMANLLRIFGRKHSGVQLEFVKGDPSQHTNALRQLQIDVAFFPNSRDWSGCDVRKLWSERLFLALPETHKLTQQESVSWGDIATESFVTSDRAFGPELHAHLLRSIADPTRAPKIQMHHVNEDALFTLVYLGRGLAITSEARTAAIYPGVVYRPIDGEHLQYSALWSPHNDNPALRNLLSTARDLSRKIYGPAGSGHPHRRAT